MIGVTISRCLSHFRGSLIVCAIKRGHMHTLRWGWTSRHTRWCRGTLQSGVSGLSGSVRLRSVSLIRGSLVQHISIGHLQGPRWLCLAASSYTEAVTLLFYRSEGRAPWQCCLFPNAETVCRNFKIKSQHCNPILEREIVSWSIFALKCKRQHTDLARGFEKAHNLPEWDIKRDCFSLFIGLSCHGVLKCNYFQLIFA